jgi:hypothetical protein
MLQRVLRTVAATVVATAGLAVLTTGPASAAPCPGGESPCVYLPGGTYTLGDPVTYSGGRTPTTVTALKHCDSTGTDCDFTYVNLPGFAVSSTSTAILTLTVPGEGVGLSGVTPSLYLGVPGAGLAGTTLGLTLTVSGTAFVLYDTTLNEVITACAAPKPIPPVTTFLSGYVGCSYSLTVSL